MDERANLSTSKLRKHVPIMLATSGPPDEAPEALHTGNQLVMESKGPGIWRFCDLPQVISRTSAEVAMSENLCAAQVISRTFTEAMETLSNERLSTVLRL